MAAPAPAAAPESDAPARLITLPLSHFCLKARWALERYGIPFVEEGHVLPDGRALKDSAAIVAHADAHAAAAGLPRLFPPAQREEVEALCATFDAELGPRVRRWVYSHILFTFAAGRVLAPRGAIPAGEATLCQLGALWPVRLLMMAGMQVSRAAGVADLEAIRGLLGTVSARLTDGRRYLCGDTFTAADLTFAALAMPLTDVKYHAAILPDDQMPAALLAERATLEASPALAFARRIHAEERERRL